MTDLGALPGEYQTQICALGINNSGQVVGYSNGRPFLYNGGVMTNLNDLIDQASGWTLNEANAINDSGQIVGIGMDMNRALLLTPTPEPTTLGLLALGGLLVLRRRR